MCRCVVKGVTYKLIGADGQTYGPVTIDELRDWIQEGRVGPDTRLWSSEETDWRAASEFPELRWDLPPPTPREPVAAPPPLAPLSNPGSHRWQGLPTDGSPIQFPWMQVLPAGFLIRLAAYIGDWFMVMMLTNLLTLPWHEALRSLQENALQQTHQANADLSLILRVWLISFAIHIPISMAYHVGCNTRWGATPGKWMAGLKIVAVDHSPLTFYQALGRFLAEGVCVASLFAGYLLVLWHPQRRGLHDLLAGTQVVFRSTLHETAPPDSEYRPEA
jgi:uncharacterized RDD family membrane protein YckC